MKLNIAITGASGAIYARLLAERLSNEESIESIRLIFTKNGSEVNTFEQGDKWITDLQHTYGKKITLTSNDDYYCSLASGSGGDDALVIVPCSVGMLSRIANGISDDLISRGADVMLKERRKLLMVVRETPLTIIHLQNMTTLTSAGAIIIPASPSFYSQPTTIEEVCQTTIDVIARNLNLSTNFQWGI